MEPIKGITKIAFAFLLALVQMSSSCASIVNQVLLFNAVKAKQRPDITIQMSLFSWLE